MSVRTLDLYDLLAPQFALGFTFPAYADAVLSVLLVDKLRTTSDDDLVVYNGILMSPDHAKFEQLQPQGTRFGWRGNKFDFRLTVSRDATEQIGGVLDTLPDPLDSVTQGVENLLSALRPAGEAEADPIAHPHPDGSRNTDITDYPGFAFKLEILVDVLNFELSDDWQPGMLDPVSHRVVPSDVPGEVGKRVAISLPEAVLTYRQGSDLGQDVQFSVNSWGGGGIDAPHDLAVGNFITMSPAIALHTSGEFAFSVDEILLDLSEDTTPPEILQHFGTAEDFEGLFFGQMLVYYSNDQGIGFNLRVNDALISFAGEVSLEGALDVFLKAEMTSLSVKTRIYTGPREQDFTHGKIVMPDSPPRVTAPALPPGRAEVLQNSVLQVEISGGEPPYTVQVYKGAGAGATDVWDSNARQVVFDDVGEHQYLVIVRDDNMDDTRPDPRTYAEWLTVKVNADVNTTPKGGTGTPADRADDPLHQPATLTPVGTFTDTLRIDHMLTTAGVIETITVPGTREGVIKVQRGGSLSDITKTITEHDRSLSFALPGGSTYDIEVDLPASATPAHTVKEVTFITDNPRGHNEQSAYLAEVERLEVTTSGGYAIEFGPPSASGFDPTFSSELLAPVVGYEGGHAVHSPLVEWLPFIDQISALKVDGFASHRLPTLEYDEELGKNRAAVGVALAKKLGITGNIQVAANSNQDYFPAGGNNDRTRRTQCFRLTATFRSQPGATIRATINRPPPPPPTGTPKVDSGPTPKAPPPPNDMPTVLNRLGFRVRFERNEMVLLELSGELDFETALEKKLREEGAGGASDELRLVNGQGERESQDGVVQFRALYTYNTATSEYGVGFALGSHPGDPDGLLHMKNGTGSESKTFQNIFGALALFAPIINSTAVSAAKDSDSAGAWIGLGVSLAVPIAVGGLNIVRTRRVVLYGGELMIKFSEPGAAGDSSFQLGIMFDYGVEFDIVVPSLGIGTDRDVVNATAPPLKVRYKAIGFALHRHAATGGLDYSPIFDSSKGYDLQLTDPSLFKMDGPLGNLFGVAAARLARFNPLTLELDMAIKQDLGVITVDKFKVKIPLDGSSPVQIMPSGVRVNIPGTLLGNGFVNIVDTTFDDGAGGSIQAKGIEGGLDLTIVPMKLRVAGNVGVTALTDPDSGREGVGVFVGLRVEFPSPIVLGASGLGLYGVLGLFAMHYRRLEKPVGPTDPVGPALHWLKEADGDPTQLQNGGKRLWAPAFDRWSFGVGVILGTMDTGFTANFQGMFVLELPGPRILIMVKMKFVSAKPEGVDADAAEITTGIIAVIDIDFEQEKITIGVLIDFEIEEVLQLKVPIEILFSLNDPSHWHIWLGTYTVPVSANILGIARGSAYFMIQGHKLTFPTRLPYISSDELILGHTLQGVAMALGMEASLLYGSKRARLYLEIGAGFHVGLSFQPFVLVGSMFFRGELMLFVTSIGAQGKLSVEISRRDQDPYYVFLQGSVCGSIDLWFFEVSACIEIKIQKGIKAIAPPPLISGVYLQSYAPVLASGQGGSRPIDASLGNAVQGKVTTGLPVVPIDTIPVLQFSASPLTEGLSTFTENPDLSPDPRNPDGWVQVSDRTRILYELQSLTLKESNGVDYADPNPVPATWRLDVSGEGLTNGSHRSLDLALFSRVPTTADRAVERSEQLRKLVDVRWGNLCTPPAPPAPVFYTFCGQGLGPSHSGWILRGTPKPDPEGTLREDSLETSLKVSEPNRRGSSWERFLAELGSMSASPARVIGVMDYARHALLEGSFGKGNEVEFPLSQEPDKTCIDFAGSRKVNPLDILRDDLIIASDRNIQRLRDNIFRPVDITRLTAADRLAAIVDDRRLGTVPTGRVNLDRRVTGRLNDNLLSVDRNRRSTTITHDGVTLSEAQIIDHNGSRGVKLGTLGIQFREAVCRVELTIIASTADAGHVTVIGDDAAGRDVDKETVRLTSGKADQAQTIVLEGEGMVTLAVRTKAVNGVITKLCYYRNCKGRPEEVDYACLRVLQLGHPALNHNPDTEGLLKNPALSSQVDAYTKENPLSCHLDLATGQFEYFTFMAAVFPKFMGRIRVQELDANGQTLHEHRLSGIPNTKITDASSVPPDWLDEDLPWRGRFLSTARFVYTPLFEDYDKLIFRLEPKHPDRCVVLRFVTTTTHRNMPPMYLAAAELLRSSELEREAFLTTKLRSERDRLQSYLGKGESDRPLLKPDTIYHLTVGYKATIKTTHDEGVTKSDTTESLSWSFQTDDEPPAELRPYILGTTPELDDEYHFFKDPLKVVFNDRSTLELYRTYGKTIVGVIRKADGGTIEDNADELSDLAAQHAEVLTPYREMVLEKIASGELPCLGGGFTGEHGVYEAPFKLQPLMAYTFDLEVRPLATPPESENYVPPLRRAFRTSRFADVHDFAKSVSTLPVHSMALLSPLPPAPAAPPTTLTMDDVELEDLLDGLGVPLSDGAERTAIWLLWQDAGSNYRPAGLLIDAAEPMWRSREIMAKRTITDGGLNKDDPAFQIWETGREPSLEVGEATGGNLVSHIIRSTGGTRALIAFDPARMPTGSAEVLLKLELRRPGNTFYALVDDSAPLLQLTLTAKAPWE